MEKASRAIRRNIVFWRSGTKLMSSLGDGTNSDMNVMISEVKNLRNSIKSQINAETSASQDMLRWSANEENRAIQDVCNHISELNLQWTEAQRELNDNLKDYMKMLELVLEGEKHVKEAKNNLDNCENKEKDYQKKLKKTCKKGSVEERMSFESKVTQAQKSRDVALLEVCEKVRENEAVKMIRLKEGLTKISEAYMMMGKKCSILFEAERDVANLIPDVHGQNLEEIKYTGALHSQAFVQRAKEKVQACEVKPLRRSSSLPRQSQLCRDRSSPYETPEQSPKKASSCDSPSKSSISGSPSKSSISDSPSKSSMSDSPSKSSMYEQDSDPPPYHTVYPSIYPSLHFITSNRDYSQNQSDHSNNSSPETSICRK
ncbi:coiled-coil domain-containing protein 39-like isoform X1 [Mytilus edulis]|uniref:coiled-coil domain-containing protein 39-like isoform X1 n=1 Tax=Mytilus edulis TaxID=6550 RepID=UPI0039EE73FD